MTGSPGPRERFDRFVAAKGAASESAASPRASANQRLVRRYFDMWNTGDGSVAEAVLAPTYLDHAHPEVLGPAAFRSLVPRFRAANPGAVMRIEIAAADDEFVAVRNAISRTVDGQPIESEGVALFRVAADKLTEQWSCYPDAEVERTAMAHHRRAKRGCRFARDTSRPGHGSTPFGSAFRHLELAPVATALVPGSLQAARARRPA